MKSGLDRGHQSDGEISGLDGSMGAKLPWQSRLPGVGWNFSVAENEQVMDAIRQTAVKAP
jgi:hypothetical protein